MTTGVFIPADQDDRAAICDELDLNLCVEAGAGTGKTTVLVDRIVRVLATGHAKVHELAVITFTEKAAAELSGRVRQRLDAARAEASDERERAHLEVALAALNQAHIETIHAFAAGLLRERPMEAGLDPGFDVLDELPAQLDFEAAYDEWITAEMAADPPPRALLEALNLGLEFGRVREAAELLHRHRDLLPLADYGARHVDVRNVVAELAPAVDELRALRSAIKRGCEFDEAYGEVLRAIDMYALFEAITDDAALRGAIVNERPPSDRRGKQDRWRTNQDCRRAKALLRDFAGVLTAARNAMREAAVADIVLWLQGFALWHERRRRDEGKAGFDDLLIWARGVIRDHPDVCTYFQRKYRSILVDEFQDTDPLQTELIVRLCADGVVTGNWRKARLRPGSLFVVGDPKQSIYRFRRADIGMYDDVKQDIFGGHVRWIRQNFRSAEPIIAWVNHTFSRLFAEMRGIQPAYVPLEHHPAYVAEESVTLIRAEATASDGRSVRPSDVRKRESEILAGLVRRRVDRGEWSVRIGKGDEKRAARYRDVAIMVPMRTELEFYEDALARAGVPYRHEGGRTFFLRQEVRELIAVLRAIDDPGDGIAAIAALRSPAFGCSDEELLLHRTAGWRFDHTSLPDGAEGVVSESLRVLREFAQMRHDAPLPDLVRAVLDRTRLVEFAMLQPQGEQTAANLLKIIDQARTFAQASGRGLRGFVRWLKENSARQVDETDAPISEEADDVVRIITVHASKGLEFPVVVFANMHTGRRDWTHVIADRAHHRLQIKLGRREDGFRTPGYEEADGGEAPHREAEDLRLLYVAATRAKDRLVVPFISGAEKERNSEHALNDLLRRAGADEGDALDLAELSKVAGELPIWRHGYSHAAPAEEIGHVLQEREEWLSGRETLLIRAAAPLVVHTATSFKAAWDRETAGGDDMRRGRAADFGSAVHALLERAGLREQTNLEAMAAAVAAEFGQIGREAEITRVARAALDSDAVARARRSPRALQEVAFTVAAPIAGSLADGRIDLLFEEDGHLVIVDFKTDAVSGREVEQRAAFYRSQALVYAWAARETTGMPVREVIFLFARPGVEWRVRADDAFLTEAETLLCSTPAPLAEEAMS